MRDDNCFMRIPINRKIITLLLSIIVFSVFVATGGHSVEKSGGEGLAKANEITELKVSKHDDIMTIAITGNGKISKYRYFQLPNPHRLTIDLLEVTSLLPKNLFKVNGKALKKIRVGEYNDKVRIVLDFQKTEVPPFEIVKEKNSIVINLGKVPPESRKKTKEIVKAADNKITKVAFKYMDDKSRVIITSSGKLTYDVSQPAENEIVLKGENARISEDILKNLAGTDFNGAIKNAALFQSGSSSVISIKLKKIVPYLVTQTDNIIYLDFELPKASPPEKPAAVAAAVPPPATSVEPEGAVKQKELSKKEVKKPAAVAATVPPPATSVEPEGAVKQKELSKKEVKKPATVAKETLPPSSPELNSDAEPMAGGYQGRKISLDFHKADIHNVFRVISDVCEKNLVIGARVKGTVTIKLIDVPWDQALDVILQNNKLDKLEVGNVIRIAPRKEIEAELKNKEAKILAARKAREILAPLITEVILVNYANADDIVSQVGSILTPDRGKVSTDERTNALIVRDVETTIERVRKFIVKLDQPTPQVLIEARIVQFNPSYTKDIGIRWDADYRTESLGKGDSTYRPPIEGNIHTPNLLGYNYDATAGAGALASGALGQMAFGFISDSLSLDIELNALEKEDKVTIISRPRIMTLDNKEATIEQGVDLPYLKLSEQGVTSTEFKKATLELKVKPHITPDGSVIMQISAKKDQKSSQTGAGGEPGIDTKKAETEVLVKDGQTVVIGGIIEENEVEIEEWVPFFSKIPLFGRLFQKSFTEKVKSDLTIFITPKIIDNKSKIATNG